MVHLLARRQGRKEPGTGVWVGAAAPGPHHCPSRAELSKDWTSLVIFQTVKHILLVD